MSPLNAIKLIGFIWSIALTAPSVSKWPVLIELYWLSLGSCPDKQYKIKWRIEWLLTQSCGCCLQELQTTYILVLRTVSVEPITHWTWQHAFFISIEVAIQMAYARVSIHLEYDAFWWLRKQNSIVPFGFIHWYAVNVVYVLYFLSIGKNLNVNLPCVAMGWQRFADCYIVTGTTPLWVTTHYIKCSHIYNYGLGEWVVMWNLVFSYLQV